MESEEKLISKKEVLEKTGISYGQLYRWKRKGLIPEGWFIRRSTFTGQETFFPEEKILERIERVKNLKEDHELDDLARLITERVNAKLVVRLGRLRAMDWWDEKLAEECCHIRPPRRPHAPRAPGTEEEETIPLNEALCMAALRPLRDKARPEEVDLSKRTLERAFAPDTVEELRDKKLELYLLRKRLSAAGIQAEISLAVIAGPPITFDPDIEVVQTVDLGAVLDRMKLELGKEEA